MATGIKEVKQPQVIQILAVLENMHCESLETTELNMIYHTGKMTPTSSTQAEKSEGIKR